MYYKSLLTVLTDTAYADDALPQLSALARAHEAHAEALCLGVDRTQTSYFYEGASAILLQETFERARAEADEIIQHARKSLGASGVLWSAEDGVAQLADISRHVAYHARFCDLTVLPRPYGTDRGPEAEVVLEAALFAGRSPVLVMPERYAAQDSFDTVVIGWNESAEAMAAIRKALPFLKAAKLTRIVIVDPPKHGPERSDPGGPLSQMLARHGVKCEIDVMGNTMHRVSDVLSRHLTDCNADLLVMGAYGHSRFREAILGGATRYMLEKAQIPVFMAH